MTRKSRRKTKPASVEGLPADWRGKAKALRRYGSETAALVLDLCAEDLETTIRDRDETTLSLVEAARESGYSREHLGRLVRDGKIPNAGRLNAPRIARIHLPRKATAPAVPLVRDAPRRELSNRQIVQSIIQRGMEDGTHET